MTLAFDHQWRDLEVVVCKGRRCAGWIREVGPLPSGAAGTGSSQAAGRTLIAGVRAISVWTAERVEKGPVPVDRVAAWPMTKKSSARVGHLKRSMRLSREGRQKPSKNHAQKHRSCNKKKNQTNQKISKYIKHEKSAKKPKTNFTRCFFLKKNKEKKRGPPRDGPKNVF